MMVKLISYNTKMEAQKIKLAAAITGNAYVDLDKCKQILVTVNNETFFEKLNSYFE